MSNILQLASQGRAEDVLRDLRVRALYSPYYLVKVILGYKELVDHLHLKDTELFVSRWAQGHTKQWIEWPRGFFKSTTFTIGTGIWVTLPVTEEDTEYALKLVELGAIPNEDAWHSRAALHNQDVTQLFAFETMANAKKKLKEVKWHYEENALLRKLFPEVAYSNSDQERPWNDECIRIRRVGYGQRLQEGTFEAIGVGGALQSRHYDIVWEDDLVGKDATESDTIMQSTIRWHGLLHGAFTNAAKQIRFGVSNRWGYADLNAHIRENEPDFLFHTRRAWELDAEGHEIAIFPERYPMEALRKIEQSGSMSHYDFSCQYMNDPVLPGEQEAGLDKLHIYTVSSDGQMVCSCGAKFFPYQLQRYLHYDPFNAKGVRSTSCPAIAAVGTSTDKHVFLLDYFISKGSYGEIYAKLFQKNDTWRPQCFTYEDVGHQNLTEFHIRQMEKNPDHTAKHRKFPRIVAVPTKGKAKEVRIRESLLPVFQRYKFSHRADQLYFRKQVETFPNAVLGHDYDLLDALTQGASAVWRFPQSEDFIREEKATEDTYLQHLGRPYSTMEVRV